MNRLVAIGHVVNDTEPFNHMGGSVAYITVAAKRLGIDAHIITKMPKNHEYVKELEKQGISVHILSTNNSKLANNITTFKNIYDKNGHRTQTLLQKAETITTEDFLNFPKRILQNAQIVVGTVIAEVSTALFPKFAEYGNVTILPQGYVRKVNKNGSVSQKTWQGFEPDLKKSNAMVILSEEDIACRQCQETNLLPRLISTASTTILTKGANGSIIYKKKEQIQVNAFQTDIVNDLTGAGDVYSSAFLLGLDIFKNNHQAGLFASMYATAKLEHRPGIGLAAIPTKKEFQQFIHNSQSKIKQYLKENLESGSSFMLQKLLQF